MIGLPCVVGQMVISRDIIILVAGNDFVESAPVLQIRALSMLFALFGGNLLGNAVLLPSKQEKYYMIVCIITALINVITNYILIPLYGPIGAAITTAFCSLCILIMLSFKVDKNIRFERVGKLIVSPVIGCVGIIIVCFLASGIRELVLRVVISIVFSAVVYSVIQLLFRNEVAMEVVSSLYKRIKKS